jgi:hypothetical protein
VTWIMPCVTCGFELPSNPQVGTYASPCLLGRERGVEFLVAPYEADGQLAYLSALPESDGGVAAGGRAWVVVCCVVLCFVCFVCFVFFCCVVGLSGCGDVALHPGVGQPATGAWPGAGAAAVPICSSTDAHPCRLPGKRKNLLLLLLCNVQSTTIPDRDQAQQGLALLRGGAGSRTPARV